MATTATAIAATTNNRVNRELEKPTAFVGSGTAMGLGVDETSEATEGLGNSAVGVAVGAGTGGNANDGAGAPVADAPIEGEGIDTEAAVGSGEARS